MIRAGGYACEKVRLIVAEAHPYISFEMLDEAPARKLIPGLRQPSKRCKQPRSQACLYLGCGEEDH